MGDDYQIPSTSKGPTEVNMLHGKATLSYIGSSKSSFNVDELRTTGMSAGAEVPIRDHVVRIDDTQSASDSDTSGWESQSSKSSDVLRYQRTNYFEDNDYITGMNLNKKVVTKKMKKQEAKRVHQNQRNKQTSFDITEERHAKIMSGLVPDEIIYNVHDYRIRNYELCMLFGDVSGFTDLSEKYHKSGTGGASRLTQVLNGYIGAMVQEIMSHSGDVFKFSGDAFLCFWKVSKKLSMQDAVHEAMDAAVIIQSRYGQYPTDVGVVLKVKLAIAAGDAVVQLIGTKENSHYVVVGQPVWDIKAAEHTSVAGDVIVCKNAWQYVNPSEYEFQRSPDGIYIKILGFGNTWRATDQKHGGEFITDMTFATDDLFTDSDSMAPEDANPILMQLVGSTLNADELKADKYSVRPSANVAARKKMKESLRKFILAPVMAAIEAEEPLEYLTEMRQVVVMFINIVPPENIHVEELIHLMDQSYQIACKVSSKNSGIVNKVSCFDKDLMLVIIFGLRGYKTELESQKGLRCGSEIREALGKLDYAESVSVALSTGPTYCGVVGHTLRREYTVIGIVVNKSARLMCAYTDMVCCDKETFLQSRMESKHFKVLGHKKLKGLSNIGPVYEFNEMFTDDINDELTTKFPLLGRDMLIAYYLDKLHTFIDAKAIVSPSKNKYAQITDVTLNVVIFKGDARQGKTRLLEEIINVSPAQFVIIKTKSNIRDYKMPFSYIQYISAQLFDIDWLKPAKEREGQIISILRPLNVPQLLCALNEVYNVNFDMSQLFMTMLDEAKLKTRRHLLRHLVGSLRDTKIIVSDDVECIDEESWLLINSFIETNQIFYVWTVGKKNVVSERFNKFMTHERVIVMPLPGIDVWYHIGLACQILEVWAIPVDLEKIIHNHSQGNPGWIESFLLSLVQSGIIEVKFQNYHEVIRCGLVICPSYMLARLPKGYGEKQYSLVDERKRVNGDTWKMYESSYTDSQLNVLRDRAQQLRFNNLQMIPVAVVAPNQSLDDVETDLTVDVMVLIIFDSLSAFEQLLCKASAVLGDSFSRNMLLYVIANPDMRATSLAIMKMFDIRVFCCSYDQSFTTNTTIQTENMYTSEIQCYCKEVAIVYKDLPKYAACESMRFRMGMFRETTYSLLTDNQSKDFHHRAIQYLEHNTRRCVPCGEGYFLRILGGRDDEHLHQSSNKARSAIQRKMTYKQRLKYEEELAQYAQDRFQLHDADIDDDINRMDTGSHIRNDPFDAKRKSSSADRNIMCGWITSKIPESVTSAISVPRSFSSTDFTYCQCSMILIAMYSQIVEHCLGAGRTDIIIDAYLEYAAVCITSSNVARAITLLKECKAILQKQVDEKDEEHPFEDWQYSAVNGKINTLLGYCYMELGQIEVAHMRLHIGLIDFGYTFPESESNAWCSARINSLKLKLMLNYFPSMVGTTDLDKSRFNDQAAECLSLLCKLYLTTGMYRYAECAAVWALTLALQSDSDFFLVCTCYTNMLDISYHYGRTEFSWWLEKSALLMVANKQLDSLNINDMLSVARLYMAVFASRYSRCEMIHAIGLGFKAFRICESTRSVSLRLRIAPILAHTLMARLRIEDTAGLMLEYQYLANEDVDHSSHTWYYAMCMMLILDCGCTMVPYRRCEQFYHDESDSLVCVRDPDSARSFYACMWLWCIRNDEWEAASFWEPKAYEILNVSVNDSTFNISTSCRLLEGLIIKLVLEMENKNMNQVNEIQGLIKRIMGVLNKAVKICRVLRVRYLILRAYYRKVIKNDKAAMTMIKKARQLAIIDQVVLNKMFCDHNINAWTGLISPLHTAMWHRQCQPGSEYMWQEAVKKPGFLVSYTLRLPSVIYE